VAAVVATSAPSDPYRLTRQTFRLARLPIPDVIAYPLAWLTTRVYLRPRGHRAATVSASAALVAHARPVLLVHGDADDIVPASNLDRLLRAAQAAGRPVESLVIPGGRHSWLYEFPEYRRAVARFLAAALGGPFGPDEAGAIAAGVATFRLPEGEVPFAAIAAEPGGVRTLAGVVLPGRMGGRAAEAPPPGASPADVPVVARDATPPATARAAT
jgi:acetyl esterase/lipase